MLSVGPSICINFFGVDKYLCLISLQYMVGKGLTALDVSESRAITWTVTNGPFGNTVEFGSSKVPPQNHYNNTFWTEVVPSAKSPTGKRKKNRSEVSQQITTPDWLKGQGPNVPHLFSFSKGSAEEFTPLWSMEMRSKSEITECCPSMSKFNLP